jgi:hypothetical protein
LLNGIITISADVSLTVKTGKLIIEEIMSEKTNTLSPNIDERKRIGKAAAEAILFSPAPSWEAISSATNLVIEEDIPRSESIANIPAIVKERIAVPYAFGVKYRTINKLVRKPKIPAPIPVKEMRKAPLKDFLTDSLLCIELLSIIEE